MFSESKNFQFNLFHVKEMLYLNKCACKLNVHFSVRWILILFQQMKYFHEWLNHFYEDGAGFPNHIIICIYFSGQTSRN
jgi:hypothetical protein